MINHNRFAPREFPAHSLPLETLEQRVLLSIDTLPMNSSEEQTSCFMIGDIAVSVVLLESDGTVDPSTENWTATQIQQVKSGIQEGLNWWQSEFKTFADPAPKSHLDFHIDFTYADHPVSTPVEPIAHKSGDSSLWLDSFLNQVGFNDPALASVTDIRRWDRDLAARTGSDWAFTIFVANSAADADGSFADGANAYAFCGGPYLVMTLDNGGWGVDSMGQVLAHETAHIFNACDEYAGSDSYTKRSGVYNTQNLNAYDDNPEPSSRVESLMSESLANAYADHALSPSAAAMLGWRDSDVDGIFDVLDVPLLLSGSGYYDSAGGDYRFAGTSFAQALADIDPQSSFHVTTNQVDYLQYRLDNGPWVNATHYGLYETPVSQVVPVPAAGDHTIQFRTIFSETGLTSNVITDQFTTGQPTDPGDAITLDSHHEVQLWDSQGRSVTITLRGPGQGQVIPGPSGTIDITRIVLNQTTAKSTLTIKAIGDAAPTLGELIVNGSLHNLQADNVNLSGQILINGQAAQIVLGDVLSPSLLTLGQTTSAKGTILKFKTVHDLSIQSLSRIASLQAIDWINTDGQADTIAAPSLGTLTIAPPKTHAADPAPVDPAWGDFQADLILGGSAQSATLAGARIAGHVSGMWDIQGRTGQLALANPTDQWQATVAGRISGLTVSGDLCGSLIASSLGSLRVAGSLRDAFLRLTHSDPAVKTVLGTVTVGQWVDHSLIVAAGSIASFTCGAIIDSNVLASTNLPADLPVALQSPNSTLDLLLLGDAVGAVDSATIGRFRVSGAVQDDQGFSMVNSNVAAGRIAKAAICNARLDNLDVAFGFVAAHIGQLSCSDLAGQKIWKNLNTPDQSTMYQDLALRIV